MPAARSPSPEVIFPGIGARLDPRPAPHSRERSRRTDIAPSVSLARWRRSSDPSSRRYARRRPPSPPPPARRAASPCGSRADAPPVDSLDVVGVIVPPRSSHPSWADVVRYDVAVVGEPFFAEGADAILRHNLSVHQLPHLSIGTDLPISARVLGIVNAADSQLALAPLSRDCLPAAAELRAVNWAKLVSTESHGSLQGGLWGSGAGDFDASSGSADDRRYN